MTQLPPAGWYPEPTSPTNRRWWDGTQWTEHVDSAENAGWDPDRAATSGGTASAQESATTPAVTQPEGTTAAPAAASWRIASMLIFPVVQISQQGKVIESASVYALADAKGASLGRATQVGQRRGGRLMKAMTDMDRNLQVTIQFTDTDGTEVMKLFKPGGVGPQRFAVLAPDGAEIGFINQRIRMVREAFDLVIGNEPAGSLASENWIDRRFSALDASGQAFAVVHKRYEGYARARFTSADEYIVEYARTATPDQRAVALASAIAMDIALYQR